MKKRVTKSIYCVYFSSHRFDFIQHDFHEQHTNTHKSANAKTSEIHRHTTTHTFLTTRAHSLTPTQSRILSDPQLHQQRTKSRLKRVKSCSSVLFKISFYCRVTIGQVRLRVIFLHISRTHTHHKPLRFQNTHILKSGFEAWNERGKWQVALICLHSHQHRHSIQRFSFFF